ncbi:VOC family protein [Modestobacter sp. NPDC049651]|uniref:VOC family protein n=1 Tax=unclassified Modestobacter TaxID=2643866 RepID=UPI0033DBC313
MTVIGPDFIALQVRDLVSSAAFYTERLGLRPAPVSPPHAVVFATEPISFAVREPIADLDGDPLGVGMVLWLKAEDPDAVHADLAAHGVPIVTEPFDGPFGRTFSFRDPDGYVVTLHG